MEIPRKKSRKVSISIQLDYLMEAGRLNLNSLEEYIDYLKAKIENLVSLVKTQTKEINQRDELLEKAKPYLPKDFFESKPQSSSEPQAQTQTESNEVK